MRGGDGWEAFEIEREREIVRLVVLHLFAFALRLAAGDHAIEVHCCRCRSGLLGGLGARWGGFGGAFLRESLVCMFSPLCPFTVAVVGDKAFAILAGWGVVTNS